MSLVFAGAGRADASSPSTTNALVQQGSPLAASDERGSGLFGYSVAVSSDGSTLLVGGPADDGNAGAAWIFTRSGSTWTQQGGKLIPSDEAGNGYFGDSVALSADGNTALIGGYEDGGSGAAWVFTRTGTTWAQQAPKLVGTGSVQPGGDPGFGYGVSVALSADGDTALIGDSADNHYQGAAWAFTRSGATWTQDGSKLTGAGADGAAFGSSVALSGDGNTALIGGYMDNNFTGAAWFFTRSGGSWSGQGAKLTAGQPQGLFGLSVALSGDGSTALIGCKSEDNSGGAVRVYTRTGGTWAEQGRELHDPSDPYGNFGHSVALSTDGSTALIGDSPYQVGKVWLYTSTGSTWTQTQVLAGPANGFGRSVALAAGANTVVVGSDNDSGNTGTVSVFASPDATVTTSLSATSIGVGGATYDRAALAGVTASASGTVTYTVYGDSACTQKAADAGTVTVTDASVPPSHVVTFADPGVYYWRAAYSGDADNPPAASPCSPSANEKLTVIASSDRVTTRLSARSIVVDGSVVDAAKPAQVTRTAGGTITYTVYSDASCTQNPSSAGTVAVSGRAAPPSAAIEFPVAGSFYWQAMYSGDAGNDPAWSACAAGRLLVEKAAPGITTNLSARSIGVGGSVSAIAALSGLARNAAGTVTYTTYSDAACSQNPVEEGMVSVVDGSVPASDAQTFLTAGNVWWQAAYSGDQNDDAAVSACKHLKVRWVAGPDDAVAFQLNPTHTGVQADAWLSPPFVRRWVTSLPSPSSYPLIAAGKVFVTAAATQHDAVLYALSQTDGSVLWQQPIAGTFSSFAAAAYDDGRVFVISSGGLLQAFAADTGKLAWSTSLPSQYEFTAPPTAADGVVFVTGAGLGGTLYAVDESSGALLGHEPVDGSDSSPTVAGGSVVLT